jgi:hypothetical protein
MREHDLTYKIFHIKVGSEKYWEEVKGFINCDGKSILLKSNKEGVHYDEYLLNAEDHISPLAKKLGAKIYGGFEDEKDFYIVLLYEEGLKSGDVLIRTTQKWLVSNIEQKIGIYLNYKDDEEAWPPKALLRDIFVYRERRSGVMFVRDIEGREKYLKKNYEKIYKEWILSSVENNLFEEYARTGIIENDLYKHFF